MLAKLREARKNRTTAGEIGIALLHLVFVTYMVYSAYHGINATASYRATSGPWAIAGIIGIISVELMLAGLYLAAMKHLIVGSAMMIAAGAAGALGFMVTILNIIGDSQMNAGLTPPPWLHTYLTVILPAAPFVAAAGSFFVLWFSPQAIRRRKETQAEQDDAEDQHEMDMQIKQATRDADMTAKGIELDTRLLLLDHLREYAAGPDARRMIAATAEREGPNLLRAAGVYVSDSDAIPAPRMSNSTHDAARHAADVIPLAQPTPGQGGNGPAGHRIGEDTRPL